MTRNKGRRKCNKTQSFKTVREAEGSMRRIKEKPTGLMPVRIFWCGQHKAYHITSKPRG